jgi:hypothetical protein
MGCIWMLTANATITVAVHIFSTSIAMMLDSDSDGGEGADQLTINAHYAKAYAHRKEREELQQRAPHSRPRCMRPRSRARQ